MGKPVGWRVGFPWVRVQVAAQIPGGYPCLSLGTGTGWVSPTRAIPVPPAGGWRVGPHIQTPREIDPNDARRIVWALCRYVFLPFFSRFSKLTHSLYSI